MIVDRFKVSKEMEDKGEIKIVGPMYDVATGNVQWYEQTPAKAAPPVKAAPPAAAPGKKI